MATLTADTAFELAQAEFDKFSKMFHEKLDENPDLSYEEVNALVDYEHPSFDNDEDDQLYTDAAALVAYTQILSTLL
jgi:hypothetical protein